MITPRFQLAVALILTALVSGTGATCARRPMVTNYTPPPVIFNRTPTTAELAEVINRTDQITKLQSNSTTIQVTSMAALPRLNANVAIERPRRIRIQAAVPLLPGSGLDLGSNDQFYWMRVPELSGPTLYYAAHSNTLGTYRADLLSVEPVWLIDALGLARIDTAIPHTEPVVQANGLLEVRSAAIVGGSMGQRVLLIDQQTAPSSRSICWVAMVRCEPMRKRRCSNTSRTVSTVCLIV